ncbi:hypothetical protein POM88_007704 [Heracleum sosnowskyi]|uniref:Uncharacterized protein n=1 Tax=Heracleum sosnowskyi TaxID=360622 RepID=A0AAD8J822_9APIA|nr:hypothetical protein POM88_007704 [Heracleum sosnowskyi]
MGFTSPKDNQKTLKKLNLCPSRIPREERYVDDPNSLARLQSTLELKTSSVGGFYAINPRGQVLLATVNESTIVPCVSVQLNNLEVVVNLAKRRNLDVIYDPLCIPHLIRVLSIILRQRKADSHVLDESSEHLHDEKFAGTCEERETLDRHLKEFDSLYSMSPCTNNKSSDRWCERIKQVPVAYIASVVRNIDTFNYFLTVAEQADLSVTYLIEEIQ